MINTNLLLLFFLFVSISLLTGGSSFRWCGWIDGSLRRNVFHITDGDTGLHHGTAAVSVLSEENQSFWTLRLVVIQSVVTLV